MTDLVEVIDRKIDDNGMRSTKEAGE